jgi:hypothetical protein
MKSKSPAKTAAAPDAPAPKNIAAPRTPRAKKSTAPVPDGISAAPLPNERVARRAYELFLEQGAEHGRDLEHWFTAERELLTRS